MLFSEKEIMDKLSNFPGWTIESKALMKQFHVKDFVTALRLVNSAGEIAEELNHHPDVLIHGWNNVKFMISTHDAGGITSKDFELIQRIEKLKI
ncbi:MAG: 4a-hydroxytetrahydrobiopterin dehydratase [Ignavibacteriaceae bacterium]|nr:4a-hydroxytetrahydrobiopterin dehydratase [Ignavibacteriaceae bacterium]